MTRTAIVGAGWAGAVTARLLHDAGIAVEVFEKAQVVGGHSRAELLDGVVYEPNGAHIFHTSDQRVRDFVVAHGLSRPYEHRVLTEAYLHADDDEPVLLSWPPQMDELAELAIWPSVESELAELPPAPVGDNFEEHVISLMGPTLYAIFIRDYTVKQWGCDPRELSSVFAPKRVELRNDGYRRLFRDRWEFFHPEGVNSVIESVLAPVPVVTGHEVRLADLDGMAGRFDSVVVTAALDDFVGRPGSLAWRGIEMRSRFVPTDELDGTVTPAYVVNRPSARVPHTRTVETKHASGQQILGTVVSEEIPGAPARHYPVHTVDRVNEITNQHLQEEIRNGVAMPVYFAGRLATYRYIDQDQAIVDAMDTAAGPGGPLRRYGLTVVAQKLTSLAFALPAYNEAGGIAEFLGELDEVAASVAARTVFVVADDCSSDRTREVVEKTGASLAGELLLEPGVTNEGHGPTVLRAYEAALGCDPQAVFQVDGDGQFEAGDVRLLVAALDSGADVVTGRRATRVDPWFRKLLTWMLRQLLRFGFGVRRRDANCPFRLYRAEALRRVLREIPDDAAVPHVLMTVVEERLDLTTAEIDVRHRVRRGDDATGTMWQSTRVLVIPWRLVSFSAGALTELLRFRRTL